MAENKQYITQSQENGNIIIAEEVLVGIIAQAVTEVDGVSLSGKPGKNWGKGIKITIVEDDAVEVKVYINVNYNQSVTAAAADVQDAVRSALESMTGVKVLAVNINVYGITRQ